MPEMIERVARKIFKQARSVPPLGEAWKDYENDAREVIEAMREPTEAMLVEGGAKHFGNDSMSVADFDEQATEIWQAMINAALKE